jgi:membrane fusion protein, multidrug efflux system
MNRRRMIVGITLVAAVAAVAAYSKLGDRSSAAQPAPGRPPVAVEVAPATRGAVVDAIEVVGQLAPKRSADLKSEFTAVVAEVYVTEWTKVERGQPLARLDARESALVVEAAKASLLQVQVAQTRAARELERARRLKEYGLATQQQLDDAATAGDAAAAVTAAAKAQLEAAETHLGKAVIRAPFDGVVAFRGVNVGDRVESMGGGPMFTIVDNRALDLTVNVPASRMATLCVGQPLEFTTEAAPGRTFAGTVAFINPAVDPASRTVKVMATVNNDDGALRSGLFVEGRIRTGERADVLQIPRVALLSWDVERSTGNVFVIRGAVAERRVIRTGTTVGEVVEVVEGLADGERVVTRGAFNLHPGDRVVVATPEGA